MKFGFLGRILRIDLDHLKYSIEEKDENFYRMFMGGRAIGLYYLIEELPNTYGNNVDIMVEAKHKELAIEGFMK